LIDEGLDDDETEEPKEVLLCVFNSCVALCSSCDVNRVKIVGTYSCTHPPIGSAGKFAVSQGCGAAGETTTPANTESPIVVALGHIKIAFSVCPISEERIGFAYPFA
jgi:hypothetical protein